MGASGSGGRFTPFVAAASADENAPPSPGAPGAPASGMSPAASAGAPHARSIAPIEINAIATAYHPSLARTGAELTAPVAGKRGLLMKGFPPSRPPGRAPVYGLLRHGDAVNFHDVVADRDGRAGRDRDPVRGREPHQIRRGPHDQLAVHVGAVGLDGLDADAEPARHLLAGATGDDQPEDLDLPARQPFQP